MREILENLLVGVVILLLVSGLIAGSAFVMVFGLLALVLSQKEFWYLVIIMVGLYGFLNWM